MDRRVLISKMVDLAAAETPPRAAALLLGELTPEEEAELAVRVLRAEGEADEGLLQEVIARMKFSPGLYRQGEPGESDARVEH